MRGRWYSKGVGGRCSHLQQALPRKALHVGIGDGAREDGREVGNVFQDNVISPTMMGK